MHLAVKYMHRKKRRFIVTYGGRRISRYYEHRSDAVARHNELKEVRDHAKEKE